VLAYNADVVASALARGVAIVERSLPRAGARDLADGGQRDWLACQTLMREAQSLLVRRPKAPL
jgi:hypothetical protein